jgi:hypothetical protein
LIKTNKQRNNDWRNEMPIELIEQLGKHGLVGLAAAAVLYLAGKAIERGFSLTINAPPPAGPGDEPKIILPRPDEPGRLPAGRRRRKNRGARRRR